MAAKGTAPAKSAGMANVPPLGWISRSVTNSMSTIFSESSG